MSGSPIQYFQLGDFQTQNHKIIPSAYIAFRTWGNPKNPVIVYPTWYSGSIADNEWLISTSHASLNPDKYFIIVPAIFGNGQSSSPSNTPSPFDGPRFPMTTMHDNVQAQHRLVTSFGIQKVHLVTGWSMGAGQTFQWAVDFPDMVERIVPFCGAARTAIHNITFLNSLVSTLRLDPEFNNGDYSAVHPTSPQVSVPISTAVDPGTQSTETPNLPIDAKKGEVAVQTSNVGETSKTGDGKIRCERGKRAFGRIYSAWGFSQTFYREEQYKILGYQDLEGFLVGFWEELFVHKDPNNLIHMLQTWIHGDISRTPSLPFSITSKPLGIRDQDAFVKALKTIKSKALVMPGKTDLYFPPEDSEFEVANIDGAKLAVIPSIWGHFAGGGESSKDTAWIDQEIAKFLET